MSKAAKITLLVLVGAAIVAAIVWLPAAEWTRAAVTWVRGTGALGVVVFSLVFIALALTMLPTTAIYLAAGMLYGTLWGGLLMNSLGLFVELGTLVIIQTSLRKWIEPVIARRRMLRAIDRAIRQRSLPILFLLRLSPLLPFGVLNYALAITKVPLWKRLVTNFFGMLPCTFMITYVGSFLSSATELSDAPTPSLWKHVAIWTGLATSLAATLLAARATKHALHEEPST